MRGTQYIDFILSFSPDATPIRIIRPTDQGPNFETFRANGAINDRRYFRSRARCEPTGQWTLSPPLQLMIDDSK